MQGQAKDKIRAKFIMLQKKMLSCCTFLQLMGTRLHGIHCRYSHHKSLRHHNTNYKRTHVLVTQVGNWSRGRRKGTNDRNLHTQALFWWNERRLGDDHNNACFFLQRVRSHGVMSLHYALSHHVSLPLLCLAPFHINVRVTQSNTHHLFLTST